MNNLEQLVAPQLVPMIQDKWEELVKSADMINKDISIEHLAFMRTLFHLGYQEGSSDTFTQLKDVYNNDTDCFIGLFEDK